MLYRGEQWNTPADTLPMIITLLSNVPCALSLSEGVNTIALESGQMTDISAPRASTRGGVS